MSRLRRKLHLSLDPARTLAALGTRVRSGGCLLVDALRPENHRRKRARVVPAFQHAQPPLAPPHLTASWITRAVVEALGRDGFAAELVVEFGLGSDEDDGSGLQPLADERVWVLGCRAGFRAPNRGLPTWFGPRTAHVGAASIRLDWYPSNRCTCVTGECECEPTLEGHAARTPETLTMRSGAKKDPSTDADGRRAWRTGPDGEWVFARAAEDDDGARTIGIAEAAWERCWLHSPSASVDVRGFASVERMNACRTRGAWSEAEVAAVDAATRRWSGLRLTTVGDSVDRGFGAFLCSEARRAGAEWAGVVALGPGDGARIVYELDIAKWGALHHAHPAWCRLPFLDVSVLALFHFGLWPADGARPPNLAPFGGHLDPLLPPAKQPLRFDDRMHVLWRRAFTTPPDVLVQPWRRATFCMCPVACAHTPRTAWVPCPVFNGLGRCALVSDESREGACAERPHIPAYPPLPVFDPPPPFDLDRALDVDEVLRWQYPTLPLLATQRMMRTPDVIVLHSSLWDSFFCTYETQSRMADALRAGPPPRSIAEGEDILRNAGLVHPASASWSARPDIPAEVFLSELAHESCLHSLNASFPRALRDVVLRAWRSWFPSARVLFRSPPLVDERITQQRPLPVTRAVCEALGPLCAGAAVPFHSFDADVLGTLGAHLERVAGEAGTNVSFLDLRGLSASLVHAAGTVEGALEHLFRGWDGFHPIPVLGRAYWAVLLDFVAKGA